jgi:RNA polymerase sigma factor (sigma-70 family)
MSPQLLSGAARLAGSSLLRLQTDERLVALVRDGHDPAFSAVVDRYRAELLRYSERIVGESRAEDVVQQALVNAHLAMTTSDKDLQLRPWLYRIAHNAALNVLRAGRRTDELDERMASAGGVEQDVENRERLREALTAIARLPEPQRDALTLQALQGRSHEEIAEALGVSSGAARQQVHRARTTVRAAVSAITPYGLLARFAMAGGGEPVSAVVSGAGAAGAGAVGIGATVAKIGAGVIAAGAIATGTTGHVPFLGHTHKAPSHARQAPSARSDDPVVAVVAPVAATAEAPSEQHTGRRSSGQGRGQLGGEHGSGGNRGSHGGRGESGDRHGSGGGGESHRGSGDDSGHSGSGSGSSGSDDGRTGSGSHHSGSGDSGSGSGDDSGHSGSGSGSGSGSDDNVITAPVVSDGSRGGTDDGALDSSSSGSSGSGSGDSGSGSSSSGSSGSGISGGGTSGGDDGSSGGGGSDDRSSDDSLGD